MRSRLLFGVVAAAAMIGVPAVNASAIIDLQVEGGGDQQVYQLDNGNLLGLWGFDNRQGDDDVTFAAAGPDNWRPGPTTRTTRPDRPGGPSGFMLPGQMLACGPADNFQFGKVVPRRGEAYR